VKLPLVGAFQVQNAALAAGLVIATGGDPELVFASLEKLQGAKGRLELAEFIQVLEAGINDVVLIVAAVFFLASLETRIKRNRALRSIHELRAIAHVIDMHQLTKDPEWILGEGADSGIAGTRQMTPFELSRYLDYCSEMLSITGKIAALYIQKFDDGVALQAVNEVESVTTGLSGKVWQKLMILYALRGKDAAARAGSGASSTPPGPSRLS